MSDSAKTNLARWINTILVTILLGIMTAFLSGQKRLNENTEVLQIELAIVATKFENHITFAEEKVLLINENTRDVREIKETYVTREEIREMFNELKDYIKAGQ